MPERPNTEPENEQLQAFIAAVENMHLDTLDDEAPSTMTEELFSQVGQELGFSETQLAEVAEEAELHYRVGKRFEQEREWEEAVDCFSDAHIALPWREDIQMDLARGLLQLSKEPNEHVSYRHIMISEADALVDGLMRRTKATTDLAFLQREIRSQLRSLTEQKRLYDEQVAAKVASRKRWTLIGVATLVFLGVVAIFQPMLALALVAIPIGLFILLMLLGIF